MYSSYVGKFSIFYFDFILTIFNNNNNEKRLPFFVTNILMGICPNICIMKPDLVFSIVTWLGKFSLNECKEISRKDFHHHQFSLKLI